eukprot:jgi/Orpsp1_1/1186815/evm.model.d7180000053468.2
MLDALGVPTSHAKYTRVFINKIPVGLFLITDDLNNGNFLKNTYNSGNKYTVDNHVFKCTSYCSAGKFCDLVYYGPTSDKYKIYTYKGDDESDISNIKKVEKYLVPFLKNINDYPETGELNFDIEGFLKAMALEYTAFAADNFWMLTTNYLLFNDAAKDYWYFIDSDFDSTLGRGSHSSEAVTTPLDEFLTLSKYPEIQRALLDNIRSKDNNENFLKEAIKKMIKTFFNIKAAEPRIDSLVKLIKEDIEWDYSLERMSLFSERNNKPNFTYDEFLSQCTVIKSNSHPMPIKKWIKKKSENLATEFEITLPSNPDTELGYYQPKFEGPWEEYIPPTAEPTSIPTSTGKCGEGVAVCAEGLCCSKRGYCGLTESHCGIGCQREFGNCNNMDPDVSNNGRCGPDYGNTKCPNDQCCSKYGYCGSSDSHCGRFCLPDY